LNLCPAAGGAHGVTRPTIAPAQSKTWRRQFVALKERGSVSRSTPVDRETLGVSGPNWSSTIAAGRRPALRC